MKRAFTLIEMMVVVAIIGILLGIVATAAANSIKLTRKQRSAALCALVKQGLETYHAQKDKWPGSLGDRIDGGTTLSRANDMGYNGTTDNDRYVLDGTEVRDMVRSIVEETVRNNNPMLDISGLFVSRSNGEPGTRGFGMNFWEAVRGNERSRRKMSLSEMYFGYPEISRGWFRRFKMVYSVPADSMEVSTQ